MANTTAELSLVQPVNAFQPHLADADGVICGYVTTGAVNRVMILDHRDVIGYRGNLCDACRYAAKFTVSK